MKRILIGLSAAALSIGLVACGGSKPEKQAVAPVPDCVFPNTNEPAPGWVCDEPVPGLDVQAVGIAEPSKAGISFMKDMAAADARGRLAEQTRVRVNKMVKKYLGTTGVADTETVDAAASSTLKTITDEELVGYKVYKTRTGPKGRLYVLLGLDAAAAAKVVEKAAR
ncbi:MAG: LPP20 family lipoprotein, partial [Gammaproteobacteria bacterium]|nr:LPP20 family lipoprotein [Gammaproteobacteria bacterium]